MSDIAPTIDVNSVLDPLKEVAKNRDIAVEAVKTESTEQLNGLDSSMETEKNQLLTTAIEQTKQNIQEYLNSVGENSELPELAVYRTLSAAVLANGGTEEDIPRYGVRLGLQAMDSLEGLQNSGTGFLTLDTDHYIDETEMTTSIDAATAAANRPDPLVKSVFYEYASEMQGINDVEALRTFLQNKWVEVSGLLADKYKTEEDQTKEDKTFSGDISGKKGKEGILGGFLSSEAAPQTALDEFYDAIVFGGNINEKTFFTEKGNLDMNEANSIMLARIDTICEKATPEMLSRCKQMTRSLSKDEAIDEKKRLLTTIPENFEKGSHAEMYEKHVDTLLSNGKRPKEFLEWLEERPMPSGVVGKMLDGLQLFLATSGLGKLLRKLFGADSWIGKLFGSEEKKKDPEGTGDEEVPDVTKETQDAIIKKLQDPKKWEGVSIKNGDMDLTKDNFSTTLTDKNNLPALKAVLDADPNSLFGVARTKGLTIANLAFLQSKGDAAELSVDRLKIKIDGQDCAFDNAAIEKVKNSAGTTVKMEELLGKNNLKYAEYFDPTMQSLPNGIKNGEDITPELVCLLKMKSHWGNYKLTKPDLDVFLAQRDTTWDKSMSFDQGDKAFIKNGNNIEICGSGWGSNKKCSNVEEVFKWLHQENKK